MAENPGNGLPDEDQSPESSHRMAAEGMPFPWWWNGGMISMNLKNIWGMSVYWSGGFYMGNPSQEN